MNFLFVGCSITWGDELEDRLNERYSKLVCDACGANENNVAEMAQSNDWIARRTIEETRKKKYDRVYVQLTMPSRLEYFTDTGAYRFKKSQKHIWKDRVHWSHGRAYYKRVYTMQHGVENMYKNKFLIENAGDFRTQLVFLSADCCPENYDMRLHDRSHWKKLCKMKQHWIWKDMLWHAFKEGPLGQDETHPNKPSHRKIADYLLKHGE